MRSPVLVCRFCTWTTPNREDRRLKPEQQEAFDRLRQHVDDTHPDESTIMDDQESDECDIDDILDELHTHRSTTDEPDLTLEDVPYCGI